MVFYITDHSMHNNFYRCCQNCKSFYLTASKTAKGCTLILFLLTRRLKEKMLAVKVLQFS
uniref:Uncharacterized protein n=1 Tax=Arundo donax TaxID=35708 RepID=A0A0A8Y9Z2_ARUDO